MTSANSSQKDLPWVRRLRPILEGLGALPGMGGIARPVLSLCDQVDKDRSEAKLQELSEGIGQILAALSAQQVQLNRLPQQLLNEWKAKLISIADQAHIEHGALAEALQALASGIDRLSAEHKALEHVTREEGESTRAAVAEMGAEIRAEMAQLAGGAPYQPQEGPVPPQSSAATRSPLDELRDAALHNNSGVALYRDGKTEAATVEFRKAMDISPDLAAAHYNLGGALYEEGNTGEGIAEWQEAVRLDPHYAQAHKSLGGALYEQGNWDGAICHFRKVLTISGADDAHCNLGAALGRKARTEDEIAEYRAALRINPQHAMAHYNVGVTLSEQGEWQEAIAAFREALRINPNYAAAHYNIGVAEYEQGNRDKAIIHFQEALRTNPDYAKAHWYLAVALYYETRFAEAKAAAQQALRLDPSREQAKGMIEELTEKGY